MSYAQMMKWNKKHPRGGKSQYMGFDTGGGFWPAEAWLRAERWPYLKRCKLEGKIPISAEDQYNGLSLA